MLTLYIVIYYNTILYYSELIALTKTVTALITCHDIKHI